MTCSCTKKAITAREHYDRLAEAGNGRDDPPELQSFMERWDGPLFYDALGNLNGKDVLEVGIGVGRMARQILKRGCGNLTGLDISPKTIAIAQKDLAEFTNLELVLADITEFRRNLSFDLAYSVLTFMHVEDKPTALENIVASLRPGGSVVLSIDHSSSNSVDFGKWTVAVSRWLPTQYVAALKDVGCDVANPEPLIDSWIAPNGKRSDTYGQCVATLIKAVKR